MNFIDELGKLVEEVVTVIMLIVVSTIAYWGSVLGPIAIGIVVGVVLSGHLPLLLCWIVGVVLTILGWGLLSRIDKKTDYIGKIDDLWT